VAGIEDRSTVMVGGFGMAGMPFDLINALIRQGATDLTIVPTESPCTATSPYESLSTASTSSLVRIPQSCRQPAP